MTASGVRRTIPLAPPCGYMGGKRKFARTIASWILVRNPARVFDLCCGSGAVSIALVQRGFDPKNLTMVDLGPWGDFWKALSEGTLDLRRVHQLLFEPRSGDGSAWYRRAAAELPYSPEAFIILQDGSFGAMPTWWDGVAWRNESPSVAWRPKGSGRPKTSERMNLFARLTSLSRIFQGVTALHDSIEDRSKPWFRPILDGVVYVDPPYKGTRGYGSNVDIGAFIRDCPNLVLASEQRGIPGASRVVSIGARGGMAMGEKTHRVPELLNIFEVKK